MREILSTNDPYDIWKTGIGYRAKTLYNRHPLAGLLPAAVLTLFDTYLNNSLRFGYRKQEYPIVRAFAALTLLNIYRKTMDQKYLDSTINHLKWLEDNPSKGFSGYCWGIGFDWPVSRGIIYNKNTPLTTVTPYPLEAYVQFEGITRDKRYDHVIRGIYDFFEKDIPVLEESDQHLATAYGPFQDRIVINAVSYTMFSYSLLIPYLQSPDVERVLRKIGKLYSFIRKNQRADGSWFYSPQGHSFVDCFHSCIVLKNLVKANDLVPLDGCSVVIKKGYEYLKKNLLDQQRLLFRRFSVRNKPTLIRFDLYDNAEMLNLGVLMGDEWLVDKLSASIQSHFCDGYDIYSQIDLFGSRKNKNTLRWAVMPYLHALSVMMVR